MSGASVARKRLSFESRGVGFPRGKRLWGLGGAWLFIHPSPAVEIENQPRHRFNSALAAKPIFSIVYGFFK